MSYSGSGLNVRNFGNGVFSKLTNAGFSPEFDMEMMEFPQLLEIVPEFELFKNLFSCFLVDCFLIWQGQIHMILVGVLSRNFWLDR